MMSSFLVNSALILLCSTAVVQFCTVAFAGYAQQTAIQEIFGNDTYNLQGVRHIFNNNIFIYIMLGFSLLTVLWLAIRGPRRSSRPKTLEEIYAMG
jgi:LMBR1 domain-containing protein 1